MKINEMLKGPKRIGEHTKVDVNSYVVYAEYRHYEGAENCPACWSGYPKRCSCGGLVHADFGDYTSEDSYYLETWCDKPDCTGDGEEDI